MVFSRIFSGWKSEDPFSDKNIRIPKDSYHVISDYFKDRNLNRDMIIIVCIGTNHTEIIDCLGPFVGSILKEDKDFDIPVYGTMVSPVHAINIAEKMIGIAACHPDSIIIAIDASLSKKADIGRIKVSDSPIFPGNGINKKYDGVGRYSIKGCVAPLGISICSYQCDLKFIRAMATIIARGIKESFKE